jgi:hypothetical protein
MVHSKVLHPMFVERKVHYTALFTNLVGWHTGAVSFPLSDVILTQISCLLSDIMICLHSGITNLSIQTLAPPRWLPALCAIIRLVACTINVLRP